MPKFIKSKKAAYITQSNQPQWITPHHLPSQRAFRQRVWQWNWNTVDSFDEAATICWRWNATMNTEYLHTC